MRIAWMLMAVVVPVVVAGDVWAEQWDFEDAQVGGMPTQWSTAKTGTGPGSVWKVVLDESAPQGPKVLAQVSSQGPKPLFNLCVADATRFADVDLTVAVKGVKGKIDQAGGPVWRYQDNDNYYVARINPLEWNYRAYKVVQGKRTKLASADVDVDENDPRADEDDALSGRWHLIRVVHRGDHIHCYLNGKLLLEAEDDSLLAAGKVGLWTKADAVTRFDSLSVVAPSK